MPAGSQAAPMRYQILRQLRQPSGRMVLEIDAPAPPGIGADLAGNVVGRVELTNVGKSVAARGRIAGEARLRCSRCLQGFGWPFEIGFVETCALCEIDAPVHYQAEEEDGEDPIPILDDEIVDLSELVRQLIAVELPYCPLCRPDCAGLCPRCGADLNLAPCGCEDESIDPRWAELKSLKQG